MRNIKDIIAGEKPNHNSLPGFWEPVVAVD